ncbi:MAG: DUF6287 domain-containing protein [Rothia sp. (in: high G+C Gram-positive bacteria)]|uniref:DUF6287 domain-containing protein n=1 Tax=Rothia sp. (in: high G+C Gram-positive bacteria) TaxID=1885016 RepID=UPI0026DEF433|nr:DUF6287 domain-containing protein [Rothia sp. (in: high G+C Gram-positive bacteria)]MDO5751027.1 DUF6287 domain-containing protein [Rothia sp. (in: high G+C Gram-positive bacteria)]
MMKTLRHAASLLAAGTLLLAGCSSPAATSTSASSASGSASAAEASPSASSSYSYSPSPSAAASAQPSPTVPGASMNLAEITKGNYASVEGIWSNSEQSLTITPQGISWNHNSQHFAQIEGTTFALKTYRETYNRAPDYPEKLEVAREVSGVADMAWIYAYNGNRPAPYDERARLVFFPAGVPAVHPDLNNQPIDSDVSKPRILALPGNDVGRMQPTPDKFKDYILTAKTDSPAASASASYSYSPSPSAGSGSQASSDSKAIPSYATKITTVSPSGKYATIQTPSKNIGCDIYMEQNTLLCLGWSWNENEEMKESTVPESMKNRTDLPRYMRYLGVPAITLNTGEMKIGPKSDSPNFMGGNGLKEDMIPAGQVIPYGTTVYYGDFVFSSEENGLTVWNAKTGHGAFLNREGATPIKKS